MSAINHRLSTMTDAELIQYISDKDIWVRGHDSDDAYQICWMRFKRIPEGYAFAEYWEGGDAHIDTWYMCNCFPRWFTLFHPVEYITTADVVVLSKTLWYPYVIRVSWYSDNYPSLRGAFTTFHEYICSRDNNLSDIFVFCDPAVDVDIDIDLPYWFKDTILAYPDLDVNHIYTERDARNIMEQAMKIYPELDLKLATLEDDVRGTIMVIYIDNLPGGGKINLDALADVYFERLYDVNLYDRELDEYEEVDEQYVDGRTIPKSTYESSREFFAEMFDIDAKDIVYIDDIDIQP